MSSQQIQCILNGFSRLFIHENMSNRCGVNPALALVYHAFCRRTVSDALRLDQAKISTDFKKTEQKIIYGEQS